MAGNGSRSGSSRSAGGTPARSFQSPGTNFDAMKRRYDRTRATNQGLTFDVTDRPKRLSTQSYLTRQRALSVYRKQASRPLGELTRDQLRAPAGRFSIVSNPAPARAFPSQAPGRTKAGEASARAARQAAKRRR